MTQTCTSNSSRLLLQLMAAVLFVAGLAGTGPAAAEGDSSKLMLTATIAKHSSMQVLSQPPEVVITEADVARGYVDVPRPAQLAVKSNSQSGYLLVFESHGDFVRQTLVRGLSTDVQLGASGGVVRQPSAGRGMGRTMLDLGFRFALSQSAKPGVHAWPIQVSVTPL